jgi:hypothetical protein|tara:strand:- start:3218 stop:3412 length:195 start_codon:yes stop_codon:yes gene_type:complete
MTTDKMLEREDTLLDRLKEYEAEDQKYNVLPPDGLIEDAIAELELLYRIEDLLFDKLVKSGGSL